jgi:hypothetical protein
MTLIAPPNLCCPSRCSLMFRTVRSSTPCSVFRATSEPLDCRSTETKLRSSHGISIWTTRDSSISGWRSLSIVRVHTAKPQNQSERGTSLTAKRSRPEMEPPRGQFTNHPLFPPVPSHSSRFMNPTTPPPPPTETSF